MKNFENSLGYTFNNTDLLKTALTHPFLNFQTKRKIERLEFLGDKVLVV